MLHKRTVAVVVPAYNEETQIGMVIESMPEFVDRIVIVNDHSRDKTVDVVKSFWTTPLNRSEVRIEQFEIPVRNDRYDQANLVLREKLKEEEKFYTPSQILNRSDVDERIVLIDHLKNAGVGAAIASGYKWCRDHAIDCTAVMAGDGQMDPAELEGLVLPVADDGVDYVKGNRLIHPSSTLVVPKVRLLGNSILSILTKIASGYWHVFDTQTGYTVISLRALRRIRLYDIYRSYGMPNDMLVKLNIISATIREMEIKPVYNVGEHSKMKIWKVIPRVSFLLLRCFFKRLYNKYLLKDFHPLFLLYHMAIILLLVAIPYAAKLLWHIFHGVQVGVLPALAFLFFFVTGIYLLIFAMWMDIQDNEHLNK